MGQLRVNPDALALLVVVFMFNSMHSHGNSSHSLQRARNTSSLETKSKERDGERRTGVCHPRT